VPWKPSSEAVVGLPAIPLYRIAERAIPGSPEHPGPVHRCPSRLALSAAGPGGPGKSARALWPSSLDRILLGILTTNPHPCRPPWSSKSEGRQPGWEPSPELLAAFP